MSATKCGTDRIHPRQRIRRGGEIESLDEKRKKEKFARSAILVSASAISGVKSARARRATVLIPFGRFTEPPKCGYAPPFTLLFAPRFASSMGLSYGHGLSTGAANVSMSPVMEIGRWIETEQYTRDQVACPDLMTSRHNRAECRRAGNPRRGVSASYPAIPRIRAGGWSVLRKGHHIANNTGDYMPRKTGQSAAMIRRLEPNEVRIPRALDGVGGGGRERRGGYTLGSLITRGNQPMCPPFWAQVELRKCLFTRQPTMPLWLGRRSSTIHAPHTAGEPMDRVRRCCTGEMFQPTRLKGQLTPSLRPPRPACVPSLFSLYPHSVFSPPRVPPRHCPCNILLSSRSFFPFRLIFPPIPSCIPSPRTHNGSSMAMSTLRPRREKRRKLTRGRGRFDEFAAGDAGWKQDDSKIISESDFYTKIHRVRRARKTERLAARPGGTSRPYVTRTIAALETAAAAAVLRWDSPARLKSSISAIPRGYQSLSRIAGVPPLLHMNVKPPSEGESTKARVVLRIEPIMEELKWSIKKYIKKLESRRRALARGTTPRRGGSENYDAPRFRFTWTTSDSTGISNPIRVLVGQSGWMFYVNTRKLNSPIAKGSRARGYKASLREKKRGAVGERERERRWRERIARERRREGPRVFVADREMGCERYKDTWTPDST
ncbi:hypothetical protein DBV15_02341 [Temnothorax longispinosus]|uniref:Uncharacterized protein n=1 Tax=Temnothorax longispinosus TaxID=300112 RepID=A0A4S2JSI4_9HYME|nr:hypothetical protein DBV15_02341 [Temnothorax longispinosus]